MDESVQTTLYLVGLVVGLASVGAWLYFCSAYTGNDYHRDPVVRTVALTVFVTVATVKLTNPIHHLYFTTQPATEPFVYTAVDLGVVHWVVTGLAYALTAVGFYLLFELFRDSRFDTTPLGILVGITGLPAVLDVLAYAEAIPSLLAKVNFEPVGVAIFAVGVLYVVDETFVVVPRFWRQHVLEHLNEAVVVLDNDDHVRDYNTAARGMFPTLSDAIGTPFRETVPELAATLEREADVLELERGGLEFYRVRSTSLADVDGVERERVVICADVTDIERQRRELKRQTEQFDDFAAAMSRELRNTVAIVDGYLELVAEEVDDSASGDSVPVAPVSDAVDRLHQVIADLTTLARYSQPVDAVSECDVAAAVERGIEAAICEDLTCEVTTNARVQANQRRLEELFYDVLAFARANGATHVRIDVDATDGAMVISDDGTWLSEAEVEKALAYGEPLPSADAGMTLPNVRMLARGLGWKTAVDTTYRDGVRIRIEDVTVLG